jgi:hypothetical protein
MAAVHPGALATGSPTEKKKKKTSAKDRVGQYEWKQHKPWFDKECSTSADQRKWLHFGGYRIHSKLMQIILTM